MPVDSLEIENFKSYGGNQLIGPFTNFTCVIGPNGSGKSNLMDAISFVLGVQSKALRSQQLQDLIYRQPGTEEDEPTDKKKKKKSKKLFGASVTLIYRVTPEEEALAEQHRRQNEEIEDEDDEENEENNGGEEGESPSVQHRRGTKSVPSSSSPGGDDDSNDDAESGAEDGRLIRFSRTISPTGQGEYQLDGKRVTWAVYEKALSDLGVLVQARNFLVFQGDVEALARKTPTQLVQLVDMLSGSAAYQKDYDQAFTDQQDKQAATVLQWQTQKTLRQERRLLRQQKQEAERFKQLQEEQREAQTELYLWQLYKIQQDIEQQQEDLQADQEQADAAKEEQAQAAQKVQKAKKELSSVRRQLGQRQDDDITRVTSILDSKEPALAAIKTEQADLEKKLKADDKALTKARNKAASHQQDLDKLDQEMEKASSDLQVLEEEYEKEKEAATKVKWSAEQEEEYEQTKRQAKAASAQHATKAQQHTQRLASAHHKADEIERNLKDAQTQLASAQKNSREHKDRLAKVKQLLSKVNQDLKTNTASLKETEKKQRNTKQRKQELDLELEELQSQLREARAMENKNKDEKRMADTIESLKTFTSKGVYGRLCNLCRPTHKKYDLAVTVAGGRDMDAIVVDTPQTAQTCIQFLREQRIGMCTFFPLSQLQVPTRESTQHLRAMVEPDDRYRLAADVIAINKGFEGVDIKKAVLYAVGNTVVSDDMEAAREFCFRKNNRVKAVTLQGAVISKAGTMTGGNSRDENKGRWKDVEIEKAQKKYEALSRERASLDQDDSHPEQELNNYKNVIGTLENRKQFITVDVGHSEEQLKESNTLIKNLEKQIQKLQKQHQSAQKETEDIEEEVKEARQAVRDAEEEHFQAFRDKTGLTDLETYDKAMGTSREEFLENKRVLTEHMESLKNKKEYEQNRDVQKPVTRIEQRIKERKTALKAAKGKEGKLEKELKSARAELEKANEEIKELEEEASRAGDQVKEAQKELDAAKSATKKVNHAVTQRETALERLRGKLHETLQKARVEEVELPVKGEDNDEGEESDDNVESGALRTRQQSKAKKGDEDSESGSEKSSSQSYPFTQDSSRSRTHFSQAENAVVVRDREKAAIYDYTKLRDALKRALSEKEEKKVFKEFDDKIAKLANEIEAMSPNMKASEAFDACAEKLKDSSADYEKAKEDAAKAAREFERIKSKRTQLFSEAFDQIHESLKVIYTDMTKSSKHPLGGNAYLSLDETEEPYKGGLKFNAMPPMKRFRDMEHLSGGEKTVAALSLLFAIHSFRPSPVYVMDEIDCALDNVNLRKVCNYIRRRSLTDFQCIVISHKEKFFQEANSLVGICRDVGTASSRTLTLELTQFDRNTTLSSIASSPGKRMSTASVVSSVASKKSRLSVEEEDEGGSVQSSKKSRKRSTITDDDESPQRSPKKPRQAPTEEHDQDPATEADEKRGGSPAGKDQEEEEEASS